MVIQVLMVISPFTSSWFVVLCDFKCSQNLVARLRFAAGETPCSPIIDSKIARQRALFSMTALLISGTESSLEKAIWKFSKKLRIKLWIVRYVNSLILHTDRAPEGEWVKRMEEPGGNVSGLKTCLNLFTASISASVKIPTAFQWAMQFSDTLLEYCSPVRGSVIVTRTNFSNGPRCHMCISLLINSWW